MPKAPKPKTLSEGQALAFLQVCCLPAMQRKFLEGVVGLGNVPRARQWFSDKREDYEAATGIINYLEDVVDGLKVLNGRRPKQLEIKEVLP